MLHQLNLYLFLIIRCRDVLLILPWIFKIDSFNNCVHVMLMRYKLMSLQMLLDWHYYLSLLYVTSTTKLKAIYLRKSLELHITGKDLFDCVDKYIAKHAIGWDKCISMCTDGVIAMTGKILGSVTRINNVASAITALFIDTH